MPLRGEMELRFDERGEVEEVRREREIVRWVARLGAVSVGQIGRRFGVGRSVAYELVRRLVTGGLLERTQTLAGDPTLISATTAGIAYAGLGLPPATIRIGEVDHWLACADVAIELERRFGAESVLTDRELRFEEQLTRKPIASAKLGETRNGYWRLHYPDLAVVKDGSSTAYEVELTPKSRRRLETILRAWRRARHVERCIYLCPAGPTPQAVEVAIKRVRAEERVRVVELRRRHDEHPPRSLD
jgi:DNA-binding MarR family transcriptional regulator